MWDFYYTKVRTLELSLATDQKPMADLLQDVKSVEETKELTLPFLLARTPHDSVYP